MNVVGASEQTISRTDEKVSLILKNINKKHDS